MADATAGVFKMLTAEDRKTMRDLLAGNPKEEQFQSSLESYEKKANLEKKPWCRTCARKDFNRRQKEIRDTMQSSLANPQEEIPESMLKLEIDFEKYWYKGKYVKTGERPIKDTTNAKFTGKAPIIIFHDYKCPVGHGYSVNMGEEAKKEKKP